MADNPRIEELRRRVEKDPASIVLAQLAEEHRRVATFVAAVCYILQAFERRAADAK